MGRPRKPPGSTPAARRTRVVELVTVTLQLDPADLAVADRLARELARHTRSLPSRTRILRWALRELDARLQLAAMQRGGSPVFAVPGPMLPPPE